MKRQEEDDDEGKEDEQRMELREEGNRRGDVEQEQEEDRDKDEEDEAKEKEGLEAREARQEGEWDEDGRMK